MGADEPPEGVEHRGACSLVEASQGVLDGGPRVTSVEVLSGYGGDCVVEGAFGLVGCRHDSAPLEDMQPGAMMID